MSRRAFTNSLDDAPGGPGDDPALPGRLLASGEALLRDICEAIWDSRGRALRPSAGIDGPHVYTGLAGIAYLLFRKWQRSSDPTSLATASEMLACCLAADSRRPHESPTFLTGTVGLLALAAAVAHARGDSAARDARVAELRAFTDSAARLAPGHLPCELLYGRAGLLYACAFVNRHCGEDSVPAALLAPLVAQTLDAGRRGAEAAAARIKAPGSGPPPLPLFYEWHGTPYAGAAHGTAGICHALLLVERRLPPDAARLADVSGSLRYLLGTRFRSGNFPARTHPPPRAASASASAAAAPPLAAGEEEPGDEKVHWCHGAPGAALALAGAWEATHDPAFAAGALAAADVVWQRGLLRRASLCHGVAGNLFAFLAAARVARGLAEEAQAGRLSDQASRWLAAAAQQERRARCFARFMSEGPPPARPSPADSSGPETSVAAAASDGRAEVPGPADPSSSPRQHWRILVEMEEMHGGDCEASLFEGAAGVAWALCEVGQAALAAEPESGGGPYFPGFELPLFVRSRY